MRTLILLSILTLLALGLCRRAVDTSVSANDSPSSEGEYLQPDFFPAAPRDEGMWLFLTPSSVPAAFVSKRASAEVARRHKRNYIYDSSVSGAVRDPLEAKREVCELSPDCDELADHIGFQEAYRRFYGPV
ncbi:osteocalcin [Cuculus canorus]|uniref:osteocalcin n=1 Tax=Cuculus canorus TaxID=55661 RepID=UPI0023AB3F46|nr:osteocalcin [Cuculus canorus]